MAQTKKQQRHKLLNEKLGKNPFYTDEQLAGELDVSVQTIRLDRAQLAIPELRQRIKTMAVSAQMKLRSIDSHDVVGDIIDIELGKTAISVMEITQDMVLKRTGIARGFYLFAQANTLALSLVDAPAALTGVANIKYIVPVYQGDRLIAKARLVRQRANKCFVWVRIKNDKQDVFKAKFIVVSLATGEGK